MSASDPPNFIISFLKLHKELNDIKTQMKCIKDNIKTQEENVQNWLAKQPNYTLPLNFESEDEFKTFGKPGKLKICHSKKVENLSHQKIYEYLLSFFTNMYADHDTQTLQKLAIAAIQHIKQSQKTTDITSIHRTFSKKRPQQFN